MAAIIGLVLVVGSAAPARATGSPGDPDPSFGRNGVVVTDLPAALPDLLTAVAIQADGKIIVAGYLLGPSDMFVIRYNSDGSFDRTFGDRGIVVTRIRGAQPADIAIQPDAKIVVAGTAYALTDRGFVARYLPDGQLYTGFGTEGTVVVRFERNSWVNAVRLQSDGRIVLTGMGYPNNSAPADLGVARYLADGTLDPSFGTGGISLVDVGGSEVGWDLEVQPDGDIVAVGGTGVSPYGFLVARLLPDGQLDSGFGTGGTVVTQIGDIRSSAAAVALQADGGIVAAGTGGQGSIALARYLPSGDLDPSFGAGGIVIAHIRFGAEANGLAIQTDGRIVVAGRTYDGEQGIDHAVVMRLLPDGSRDPTFGDGGLVYNQGHPSVFADLALQPDGKIVVAGSTEGFAAGSISCLTQRFLA